MKAHNPFSFQLAKNLRGQSQKKAWSKTKNFKEKVDSEILKKSLWSCEIHGEDQGKAEVKPKTLGQVFYFQCAGPSVKSSGGRLEFRQGQERPYSLRILDFKKKSLGSYIFKVTSYEVGSHELKDLKVVEVGSQEQVTPLFQIQPLTFQTQSSIKDPKQKPFGPIGVQKAPYPRELWWGLFFLLFLCGVWAFFRYRRYAQKQKVLADLKKYKSPLGAFHQFHKDLRFLQRKSPFRDNWSLEEKFSYVQDLDKIFRMYLLRQFYVPALEWGSQNVVKELSKRHGSSYGFYGSYLEKFLKELDRALLDQKRLELQDCKQLSQMARHVSEKVWKSEKMKNERSA